VAKPAKYTERRTSRFDRQTDALLVEQSGTINIAPAVAIRILVEKGLASGLLIGKNK
jgi:hypothetical protein